MRKEQDFVVYPFKEGETTLKLQSDTRIMEVDVKTGIGRIAGPFQGGAYFHHLTLKSKPIKLDEETLKTIKQHVFNKGQVENIGGANIMFADNSGAKSIFDL